MEPMATTEPAPVPVRRLEDHLWQAADLFRNKQKDYILALLFFKRAETYTRRSSRRRSRKGGVAGQLVGIRDASMPSTCRRATRGMTSATLTRRSKATR